MLNIDDRLLTCGITADELYLLLHISKFVGDDMTCFPSNATLSLATGWSVSKLNEVKRSLTKGGFLEIEQRFFDSRQTSNVYKIQCEFIAIWQPPKNLKGAGGKEKTPTGNQVPPLPETRYPPTGNAATEVLTIEVLTNEEGERGEKTPLPAPALDTENRTEDFFPLNAENIPHPPIAATPLPPPPADQPRPRPSDKPKGVEFHTDLVKQIGEFYKAYPHQWTDVVKQGPGSRYTNEQLVSMLDDYCSHTFANRNTYATFAQHSGNFVRWIKNQKQFERRTPPILDRDQNQNLPRFT